MEIVFTNHAKLRIEKRKILEEEVIDAIKNPDKTIKKHGKILFSKMAVVVQEMIESKKSGVAFTINPVNKNHNEIIIESSFGLGESVVSGIVTPKKKKKKIMKETISEKKIAVVRKKGKTKTIKLSREKIKEKSLSNKELKGIIKECIKIERYYKKPMDIEWAIDDKLYILQARPITTF